MILIYWMKTNTIKRNTGALLEASREVGLEINMKETKYMVISWHQNAGQNQSLLITNKSFKMWQSSRIWEQL
jgi:hypothetical protein